MPAIEFKVHNGSCYGLWAESTNVSYLCKGDLVTFAGVACKVEEVTMVDGFDHVIFNIHTATSWKLVSFPSDSGEGYDMYLSNPRYI